MQLVGWLPDPETLRRRCQGLAVLEAVLSEDWESRYFHFDSSWGAEEQVAQMRNGSGDEWSITFTSAGVWLRGFDHESPMSPAVEPHDIDWLLQVPEPLREAATEPAFTYDGEPELTLACWWLSQEQRWHPVQLRSAVPAGVNDGAGWLFSMLDGDPGTYLAHVQDYYETRLHREDVEHVFALRPLTDDLVQRINPARTLADHAEDMAQIGYPEAT